MSLRQYILDYCKITETFGYIPTNEPWRALWYQPIILSSLYYQVDKSSELLGRRLVTINAVYLWRYFTDDKYGSVDYKRYHLIKLIKKERLKRFSRFKDQNTRRDSLYRYISASLWVGACHLSRWSTNSTVDYRPDDLTCSSSKAKICDPSQTLAIATTLDLHTNYWCHWSCLCELIKIKISHVV